MGIVGKVQSTHSTQNTISIHNSNTPPQKKIAFSHIFFIFFYMTKLV